MEKLEKILELLEKSAGKGLTSEEKQSLKLLIDSDAEASQLMEIYDGLKKDAPSYFHPDEELLASYIMYENGDNASNSFVPLFAEKIKLHLSSCSKCNEEYNFLKEEYKEVNEHLANSIVREKKENKILPTFLIKNYNYYKYAFAAVVILFIAYSGLFTVSTFTTPDYKQNVFSESPGELYRTRGRTSLIFQRGLNALEKGDYSSALAFFNEDIRENNSEGSIFYSYFMCGLTYLKASESDFLGLFKSYDNEKVKLAIYSLKKSIEKNNSGNYENLNLDANYYLGRAYILIDDINSAINYLQIVVDEKGGYYNEAKSLIRTLEKN